MATAARPANRNVLRGTPAPPSPEVPPPPLPLPPINTRNCSWPLRISSSISGICGPSGLRSLPPFPLLLPLLPPLPPPPQGPPLLSDIQHFPFTIILRVYHTCGPHQNIQAVRTGDFIVTSSSDIVGCTAQTLSKSSFVAPIFTAIPAIWIISPAPSATI